MNDILVGIVAWIILLGSMVWLYLFVKMLVKREWNETVTTNEESIEYKHTVMSSDE
jgi:hypothetical protein